MNVMIITIRCISGVLADKLVILVTHQLQYAQHADSILVLKEVCMWKFLFVAIYAYVASYVCS